MYTLQHLETHNSYFLLLLLLFVFLTGVYGVGGGGGEGRVMGQGAGSNVRDNIPAGLVRLINTSTDASCSL